MTAVVRKEHPFFADEQDTEVPLGNFAFTILRRLHCALIPSDGYRRHLATGAVLIAGEHRRGGNLRMRLRTFGFDGQGMTKLECPKGEIVDMTARSEDSRAGKGCR